MIKRNSNGTIKSSMRIRVKKPKQWATAPHYMRKNYASLYCINYGEAASSTSFINCFITKNITLMRLTCDLV